MSKSPHEWHCNPANEKIGHVTMYLTKKNWHDGVNPIHDKKLPWYWSVGSTQVFCSLYVKVHNELQSVIHHMSIILVGGACPGWCPTTPLTIVLSLGSNHDCHQCWRVGEWGQCVGIVMAISTTIQQGVLCINKILEHMVSYMVLVLG
jgi:hypothetical protein